MDTKKVLLVDDDAELCDELAEILRDEGYEVTNTSDPLKGVELIENQSFDVVILDFKMPHLTGVDLLKKIRANNSDSNVLFISGRPFVEKLLAEEKVSHLVNGFLSKPFDNDLLLEKVRTMPRRLK